MSYTLEKTICKSIFWVLHWGKRSRCTVIAAASNNDNVDFDAAKSADPVVGSKPPPSACLFMNSTAIPRVQRHVHLGITITSDLRWNDHVATVLKKVAPALHLSLTIAYRHQLPPARKFYVAFIRPRMEYSNAVWCGTSAGFLKSLEKAQLKVARAIVHSQRGLPGPEVISECYLLTLAWRRMVHFLCLLYILNKGQGPPSLSELLPATVQTRTEIVLRSSHLFRFPFASSSQHLSSFLCFSIRLWNTLPASAISQSRSVSSFRSFLHSL